MTDKLFFFKNSQNAKIEDDFVFYLENLAPISFSQTLKFELKDIESKVRDPGYFTTFIDIKNFYSLGESKNKVDIISLNGSYKFISDYDYPFLHYSMFVFADSDFNDNICYRSSIYKEKEGIYYWNSEFAGCDFDFRNTLKIANSLTEFLGQLITQNQDNPEIYKLKEIHNKLIEQGFE